MNVVLLMIHSGFLMNISGIWSDTIRWVTCLSIQYTIGQFYPFPWLIPKSIPFIFFFQNLCTHPPFCNRENIFIPIYYCYITFLEKNTDHTDHFWIHISIDESFIHLSCFNTVSLSGHVSYLNQLILPSNFFGCWQTDSINPVSAHTCTDI